MAKVKFSALISDMRNKLNGSVFAKNRGGNYLRTKVTPVNPQSVAQTAARALLSSYSQGWKGLTQDQRNAWNSAVAQWATTDIFGDIKNPTGLQLYIRLNVNIELAGGTPITLPPLPVGAEPVLDLTVDSDVSDSEVNISDVTTPVPANTTLYIEATPCISPGISNANSYFRFVKAYAAAATPGNIWTEYVAKFGTPVAGQKLFVRAKFISTTTGEVSSPLVASCIVSA